MYLIMGLGNPGAQYASTRHNIGFRAVELLAARWGGALDRVELHSKIGKSRFRDKAAVLAQPQTFMNLSGQAGQALMAYYRVPLDQLLVVHDDLDLPAGAVRLKGGGGHGGHNGLRDLVARVGPGFARLRLGIGRPPDQMDPAAYVLGRFSEAEERGLTQQLGQAADAVEAWLEVGLARAMNGVNQRSAPGEAAAQPVTARSVSTPSQPSLEK